MRKAFITGITGQDGSYLAEFLLSKGYKVYGMIRRSSVPKLDRILHLEKDIELISGDLMDESSLIKAIELTKPDEVYNLAAQSFVPASWEQSILTGKITGLGVTRMLEAILMVNRNIRFYQASSSEMFGNVHETPQKETTVFYPRSPYGVAKVYGHWITVNFRESYNLFACSGILFNHESPRRGLEFVTRKVSMGVAMIKMGMADKLKLGNLDAKRDWGFAGDYVEAMWMMLQQKKPDDFVIATGETRSVKELVEIAFKRVDLKWEKHIVLDKSLLRPAEVHELRGDSSKAIKQLGWKPKVTFEGLVNMMVDSDMDKLKGIDKDKIRELS
ncbi:MAG: GDP-mannose 4,6-dehydratase [Candidatus Theseobacter exili]|nr:GDP-mannose 4,6-dehydratase [Candidatus Theseobacter exili]